METEYVCYVVISRRLRTVLSAYRSVSLSSDATITAVLIVGWGCCGKLGSSKYRNRHSEQLAVFHRNAGVENRGAVARETCPILPVASDQCSGSLC